MGKIVVDATGDLDVAASAGAPFSHGSYIVTTVFRLGGVDTEAAERFEYEEPAAFHAIDREAKKIIGGSWDKWWLKTPLPGIVWCNCPHMTGLDGVKVEDLTRADFEGRERIAALVAFVREKLPGFERAFVVDVAPQIGVRQTRLLDGVYVMTKDDVMQRRHFPDSVARGRDYYYPYRTMLPRGVGQLLVAGRHYSATSSAQTQFARNSALHGDGRGGRRRRGARARRRRRGRRRRRRQTAGDAARAGRRSRRSARRQRAHRRRRRIGKPSSCKLIPTSRCPASASSISPR